MNAVIFGNRFAHICIQLGHGATRGSNWAPTTGFCLRTSCGPFRDIPRHSRQRLRKPFGSSLDLCKGQKRRYSAGGNLRRQGGLRRQRPREQRKQPASAGLEPGTEIRVTASQDANGEWRASRIEIMAALNGAPPEDSIQDDDSDSNGTLPEARTRSDRVVLRRRIRGARI